MIAEVVRTAATEFGEREFVRCEGVALSYASFYERCEAFARALVGSGVLPRQRVIIFLPNCLEALVAVAAAWRMGAIAVPVVPIYREHELRSILTDVSAAAVITSSESRGRDLSAEVDAILAGGTSAPARFVVGAPRSGWAPFGGDGHDAELPPIDRETDAEALWLYTSGTTSSPKGVRLAGSAVLAASQKYRDGLGICSTDVAITISPLTHITGLLAALLIPLTTGSRTVVMGRWEVDAGARLIARESVTWSIGAAVFLTDLVEYYEQHPELAWRLDCFISGGASTSPDLIRRADAVGVHAVRLYGMSEACGPVTMMSRSEPLERRATSDGRVASGMEVKVVDDDGRSLPTGSEGRILTRGDSLLIGYTDPALTSAQVRDGWFDTGDVGTVDDDGWMRITGRTKDIINRGGEKFSAADIEGAVERALAGAKVAVAPLPDHRLGEQVAAFVALSPTTPEFDPALAHDALLAGGLAKSKVPVVWFIVDELPMSATGKVQKNRLVAGALSGAYRKEELS